MCKCRRRLDLPGTSGWVATTVDRLHLDLGNLIGALVGADPTTYNYIAEVETSGKCIEWVKDRMDQLHMSYEEMIEYIKESPAGSNGVIFSPWMHGNRCPFDDANSRGVFFNLDITTKGSDLMKAVIEGVCMHMLWLLEATETKFKTNPVIRFSGGSAIAPFICQIMADVLGRDVETIENPRQVGAMGAAALMAVSFGMLDDIKDIKKIIKVSSTYKPNPENHAVYQKLLPVFKDLYKDNKEFCRFKRLKMEVRKWKQKYGVSRWPDEKEIFKKMERLVNEPLHHIKPEAMARYMKHFDEKCKGSKAMIEEAKKVIPGGVQHNLAFNYPFPRRRKSGGRISLRYRRQPLHRLFTGRRSDSLGQQL